MLDSHFQLGCLPRNRTVPGLQHWLGKFEANYQLKQLRSVPNRVHLLTSKQKDQDDLKHIK